MAIDAAHQVPPSGFEPAVADIDEAVAGGDRSARRYKRLDPDQQSLAARWVMDLRHVVVGGDYITDRHAPALLKKIGKIEFSGFATVARIDAHDPWSAALDGGEQNLAAAHRGSDRGQAAQTRLGDAARIVVGVQHPPMRLCAVNSLVDLLPDRGIEPTIAFGKTADPQIAVLTRYASSRNGGEIEFRRRAPADTAGYGRIVDAAENAARILSGKDQIHAGDPIAVPAETAYLRQKAGDRLILCQGGGGPGAGRVVAAEYLRRTA